MALFLRGTLVVLLLSAGPLAEEACREASCAATSSGRWWEAADAAAFRTRSVLRIDTLNFNDTVTRFRNDSLLIAFFDPRSKSFQDLRPALEETADALASSPTPLGGFGAVDVTVDSYLSLLEAPEITSSWQDLHKGAFYFGRPRYYPLILVQYRNGSRVRDYQGVIKKDQIVSFLKRQLLQPGAEVTRPEELHELFRSAPGPFAIACGFEHVADKGGLNASAARQAFDATAEALAGEIVFAQASHSVCSESLTSNSTVPHVAYLRASNASRLWPVAGEAQDVQVLENKGRLFEWLLLQRPAVLPEISPDNSWTYLERMAPLVIYLVDAKDGKARARGEALFSEIESRLEAKYYQLVWADCDEFASQFDVVTCPSILVADSTREDDDIRTSHISLQEIDTPNSTARAEGWAVAATASERLRLWLEWKTVAARKFIDEAMNETKTSNATNSSNASSSEMPLREVIPYSEDWGQEVLNHLKARQINARREGAAYLLRDAHGSRLRFLKASNGDMEELKKLVDKDAWPLHLLFEDLDPVDDTQADVSEGFFDDWEVEHMALLTKDLTQHIDEVQAVYNIYQARLQYMVQMEQSFQAIYGSSNINVDFSVIQRVQAMHPHMKLILSSTADVREMLRNTSLRKDVWRAIEARAKFQQDLANMEKKAPKGKALKQLRGFVKHLVHGQKELRSLFRQLFTELEELAWNGNLERPPPPQRAVPRRDASELSVEEFINAYARPGLPVIITGLNITEEEPWSLEFFKGRCTKKVPLQRRNPRSDSWGRLEKAGRLPLAEFIDSFTTNATRRKWYLHDWSLPRYCPAAFGPPPFRGFTVPKYFVGDYFQRAGFEGYQHTWPSLFIGSNETLSAMHIDSGNTNFMMHLLSGRKEWRFFSRKDLINLYYSPNGAHFHLDIFQPDLQKFPLARYAEQFVGIQEAGELIFIPAGNPHGVRNLDHIHGVSMNYVDLSNVELSILESVWDNEGDKVELYTDGIGLLVLRCAAHPCDEEVSSACPDRPGAELARCLKDKSEHESPTEISSGCADFIAVNAACAEDITKFCDEAFFSDDTALCLSTWTSPEDLSKKCSGVLEWALPKPEAADEEGPTDELGLSEKDYAEKREWQAKRKAGRSAAIEKIRQDQKEEKELEALKKEDPAAYAQLMKEREEAKRSFEELKKRKRLMAAAEERERRQKMGIPDSEEESEEEAKKRKRIEERMEILREAKKKERVNWLPYALGGLFVAYIFFNVLNVFGSGDKSKKEDDDDKDD